MKFSSYTILITYLMASLGYASVFLVEGVGAPFVTAAAAIGGVSLFFNMKERRIVPDFPWNLLAAGVFVFFITDYLALSGSLITSASRFLTVLLTLKLFDLKKNRDYLLAYSLVFFLILAAAASTVSPLFFLILTLYVFSGIWAMIMFTVKKDSLESALKEVPAVEFGWPFFVSVIVISVVSIAMTFAIFFILPRMGIGLFERKTANTLKVTGFSDRVELGSIGPVKTDPTVVMRVEVKGERPGLLYFKGQTLDQYDGKSWSKRLKKETLLRSGPDEKFILRAPGKKTLEEKILLEPLDTEYIFASPGAYSVKGPFKNLWSDGTGALRLPSPPYSRIEYTAWSDGSPLADDEPGPRYIDISYLNSSAEGGRVRELAASVVRDGKDDLEKARAMERYLKTVYRYTLNPATNGPDPLADFLFHSKEGYCEHYATAMAVMLRAVGIPSRIVTGFTQGEWSGLGGYFIVRQSDAHSWVEAYINGAWVTLDPTPSAGVAPPRPSELFLYLDLMRLKWNRYIIHYSFADQRRLALNIEGGAQSLLASLKKPALFTESRGGRPVLIALAVILSLFLFLSLRRKGRGTRAVKTPLFYIEMTRILKRKGIVRRPDETPLEFAERIDNMEVTFITKEYHDERFGGAGITKAELERVKKAVEGLRRTR